MLTIMNNHPAFMDLPMTVKTVGASAAAASMRVALMPIDTLKTTMQVEGKDGLKLLRQKGKLGHTVPMRSNKGDFSSCEITHSFLAWKHGRDERYVCWSLSLVRHVQYASRKNSNARRNCSKAPSKCRNRFRCLARF